jgi:uncharacterized protein (DUF2236 family)
VYETFLEPLTDADRDTYCADAAWVALALGARAADVPRNWADLRAAIDGTYASGVIVVGPQARELAAAVMAPRIARLVAPAAWLNRLITIGLLPSAVREQYGFSWDPDRQRRLDRVVPPVRTLRRILPDALATWPDARR